VGSSGTWSIAGGVVARPGPEAAALLLPLGQAARVEASSVLAGDPSVSGQYAFDGATQTPWLAARGDTAPVLTVTLPGPRTLSHLRVVPAATESSTPIRAVIRAGSEVREVDLGSNRFGSFEPLAAQRLKITFETPSTGTGVGPPMGVGELVLGGAEDLTYQPDPEAETGAICGLGPEMELDGRSYPTRVIGSVADVLGGTPLRVEPCGEPVDLGSGEHEIVARSTGAFAVTAMHLVPTGMTRPTVGRGRLTDVEIWGPTHRTVRVGPGADAVLRVAENVNEGWHASLDGEPLEPLRLDGWQQGYLVPAGAEGLVELTYAPRRLRLLSWTAAAGGGHTVPSPFPVPLEQRLRWVAWPS